MIALIDCNSFYCACEQVFRPDLRDQPVVVLSNNDGCVIARNAKAKLLDIPMGAVFHKYEPLLKRNNVSVFSSNFPLYADFSNRVMNVLRSISPLVDVYSIDEAFIKLPKDTDFAQQAMTIKDTIYKLTAIPVSIGVAPTKVLAKCANYWAKKIPDANGIFILENEFITDSALSKLAIKDVWGIGSKQGQKCERLNIYTAYDFKIYPNKKRVQTLFTKVGRQIQDELAGIECLDISDIKNRRQNIQSSRSFKPELNDFNSIAAALSTFASKASEKLRRQNSCCNMISIFLRTNPFKDTPQYRNGISIGLLSPTDDTFYIVKVAKQLLKRIYKPDYVYKKAGIILSDFTESNERQLSLVNSNQTNEALMKIVDTINKTYGRDTLKLASSQYYMQQKDPPKKISPCYTTKWADILSI